MEQREWWCNVYPPHDEDDPHEYRLGGKFKRKSQTVARITTFDGKRPLYRLHIRLKPAKE